MVLFAMTMLIGMSRIITPSPARMDGPRVCHRKYSDTAIWNGADQIMWRYVLRSMNRCASTDIRLTISPTVEDLRASLVTTRD